MLAETWTSNTSPGFLFRVFQVPPQRTQLAEIGIVLAGVVALVTSRKAIIPPHQWLSKFASIA